MLANTAILFALVLIGVAELGAEGLAERRVTERACIRAAVARSRNAAGTPRPTVAAAK